jgi:hypothetical protein
MAIKALVPWMALPRSSRVMLLIVLLAGAQWAGAQEADSVAQSPMPAVVPRAEPLKFAPCEQCHQFLQTNSEVRTLMAPHVRELAHGDGRIWCLNCHGGENHAGLVTLLGEAASFEDGHEVCGGCHARRYRDWRFGAHGKRADSWQGERTVYGCTHCHDPHNPALAPRAPEPPPPVRVGLDRPEPQRESRQPAWAGGGAESAP